MKYREMRNFQRLIDGLHDRAPIPPQLIEACVGAAKCERNLKAGGMKRADLEIFDELLKQLQGGGIISPEVLEDAKGIVDQLEEVSGRRAEQHQVNLFRGSI